MVNCGVFVRLEAKEGKEAEVESFLMGALDLANQEAETPMWFAVKFSPSSFAIYDVFESNNGREDHLGGQVAAGLMARADELFANKLSIELFDVLAAKLP
jgi:hypothetical protein